MPNQDDPAQIGLRALYAKVAVAFQDPSNQLWLAFLYPQDEAAVRVLNATPKSIWGPTVREAARLEKPFAKTLYAVGEPLRWDEGRQSHLLAADSELPSRNPVQQTWLNLAHECLSELRHIGRLSFGDPHREFGYLIYWVWNQSESEKVIRDCRLKVLENVDTSSETTSCTFELQILQTNLFQELLHFLQAHQSKEPPYLDVAIRDSTVLHRKGMIVDFDGRIAPLQLVQMLSDAGPNGRRYEDLIDELGGLNRDALDKRKRAANALLIQVGLEVLASEGRWTLVELERPSE